MTIDKYLPDNSYQDSYLYRVGMISMIAIILHNIPEGIATYLTTNHDLRLGITLAFALALHNIPEGISIAVPIYYSTKNRKKAFLYTLVSGMSEFLGAIFASIFLTSFSNDFFMGCLYAIIAGIMIHISVYELLPSSLKYHKYSTTFLFFFLGIIVMFISCLLLH
jgi:ZIP family zinc transporter